MVCGYGNVGMAMWAWASRHEQAVMVMDVAAAMTALHRMHVIFMKTRRIEPSVHIRLVILER